MKIQSRSEKGKRLGRYKDHTNTPTLLAEHVPATGIELVSAYLPTEACPELAKSCYHFAFGMDQRRVLLTLDFEELMRLKWQLDEILKNPAIRRIK